MLFHMESILNFSLLKRYLLCNYNLCASCLIAPTHYRVRLLRSRVTEVNREFPIRGGGMSLCFVFRYVILKSLL